MKSTIHISEIEKEIVDIIRELSPFKGNLYLVGGAIRDLLNGSKPDDYDILADYSIDKIIERLKRNHNVKIAHIENRINPLTRLNIDNKLIIDFSLLIGDLETNLLGRDFTVNSLAININELIEKGESGITDLFGGIKHAHDKILFPTTDNSLEKDPLRILRAFRLKLYKGYSLSVHLSDKINKSKHLLSIVKGERIWMELKKILKHNKSYPIFFEIVNMGILDSIIPEIEKMRTFTHNKPPAKTLLEHSLYTHKKIEKFLNNDAERLLGNIEYFDIPILKLSAFLHDIGKLYTKGYTKDNKLHFYNHEIIGAKRAVTLVKENLSFSNVNARYMEILIENHMRPHLFSRIPRLSDHAIYRFIRDCEGHTEDVITLSIADGLSTNSKIDRLLYVAEQVSNYIERNSRNEVKSILNGNEIMHILFLKPSALIGRIKEDLIEHQVNGVISSKEDAITFLKGKYEK